MPSTLAFDPIAFLLICTCLLLLGAVCAYIGGKVWEIPPDPDRYNERAAEQAQAAKLAIAAQKREFNSVSDLPAPWSKMTEHYAERTNLQAQMDEEVVARVNALEAQPKPKLSRKR